MLISYEEVVSHLYNTYGTILANNSDFWFKMSTEEMQHAALLRNLHQVLDRGNIFHNLGRFHVEELQNEIDIVVDAEIEAQKNELSHHTALNNALKCEQTMVESNFYMIVDSDDQGFKTVAARLIELTKAHLLKLQN